MCRVLAASFCAELDSNMSVRETRAGEQKECCQFYVPLDPYLDPEPGADFAGFNGLAPRR
eukprot:3907542-Pyramimonas_sp.AAC.1